MEGDWVCPNMGCQNHATRVHSWRTHCPMCNAPRGVALATSPLRRFVGTLHRFFHKYNHGFLRSEAVKREYDGHEVYLHWNQLETAIRGTDSPQVQNWIGEEFSFTIQINNKGQPMARNVLIHAEQTAG